MRLHHFALGYAGPASMESPAHANDECVPQNLPHSRRLSMASKPDNDNNLEGPMVFIIISKAYEIKDGAGIDLHIILLATEEASAVREGLNALAEDGRRE